jgi:hypothetical protein
LELLDFGALSVVRYSKELENMTFRKSDLFPSSGEVGDTYSVLPFRKILLPSGSFLSEVRLPTHIEDLYDLTDLSWVSVRFWSRGFNFYPTCVRVPIGGKFLPSPRHPDWFWDPPSVLSNG